MIRVFREFTPTGFDDEQTMIPYWSIVVPLALISAWLLLSKPRPTKPNEPADPSGTIEAMNHG